ncbi:MAG: two-component regulator propeller domain-containing protein, partial [Bacteroidota bacterium]|nr:hypothetical protein [Candidatus Kapabacteria bacterium]MDW8220139.1 two-component regulator propeller domain-containing protein [Bacteroidota bacterium]
MLALFHRATEYDQRMQGARWTIACICLLHLQIQTLAQFPMLRFKHYTIKHGLPQNTVLCIAQDQQGFIWLGTQDGLCRYDGYSFRVFRHRPNDSTTPSVNYITRLHVARDGTLWIGTADGGLNAYNYRTQRFTVHMHKPENPHSIADNTIQALYEDQDGTIWVGTEHGGLSIFSPKQQHWKRLNFKTLDGHILSKNRVYAILKDHQGTIWVGTYGDGLYCFRPSDSTLVQRYCYHPANPQGLNSNIITSLHEDSNGNLWIGTIGGGISRLDTRRQHFTRFVHVPSDPSTLSNNSVWSIERDSLGSIWIATNDGLNLFDHTTERFLHYKHNPSDPSSLSDNLLARTKLFCDRHGVVWIGTNVGGVNTLDIHQKKFYSFRQFVSSQNVYSASGQAVRALYEDHYG